MTLTQLHLNDDPLQKRPLELGDVKGDSDRGQDPPEILNWTRAAERR